MVLFLRCYLIAMLIICMNDVFCHKSEVKNTRKRIRFTKIKKMCVLIRNRCYAEMRHMSKSSSPKNNSLKPTYVSLSLIQHLSLRPYPSSLYIFMPFIPSFHHCYKHKLYCVY